MASTPSLPSDVGPGFNADATRSLPDPGQLSPHDTGAPKRSFRGVGKIALFFVLIVILAFFLDVIIDEGVRRIGTSKFGSLNRVMSGAVNADIVINGSSRALTHYDPLTIERITGRSAYNLGMNGVQIDVQLAILKAYLKHNGKPKLVIQNLESFSFETTRPREIYDPGVYLPYLSEPELYEALLAIDPTVKKWKHIPLYGYAVEDMRFTWAEGLAGWFGISKPEDYFLGFNPRYLQWTEDFERFRAAVGSGVRYRIDPKGVDALREILSICKVANIPVFLVYSPEYFEMQALELNRPEIFRLFAQLSQEFGAPLWDYSGSPLCRQRDNFYNSQHLNAQGAALFTADVAARIADWWGAQQ